MQTNNDNILTEVVEAVTEKPLTFTIDISPRKKIHKWAQENKYLSKYFPRKKEFVLHRVSYGNMLRISAITEAIGINDIDPQQRLNKVAFSLLNKHGRQIAKAVAYAIHNRESEPPRSLINDLIWNLSAEELLQLVLLINTKLGLQSFITTTVYLTGLNVLEKEKPSEAPESKTGL